MQQQPKNLHLTFVVCPNQDELQAAYHALLEIHERAKDSVSKTNQLESHYLNGLKSHRHPTETESTRDEFNRNQRTNFVSAALNQWFLRRPYWDAIQTLLAAVKRFRQQVREGCYREDWAWTMAAKNNVACSELLVKNALYYFSRFTDFPEEHTQFLEGALRDCDDESWLDHMPEIPACAPNDNGMHLARKAQLYREIIEAITSLRDTFNVQLEAIVDTKEIPRDVVIQVALYFKDTGYQIDTSSDFKIRISRKPQA